MKRIAKFEKVSLKQFVADWEDTFSDGRGEDLRNAQRRHGHGDCECQAYDPGFHQ